TTKQRVRSARHRAGIGDRVAKASEGSDGNKKRPDESLVSPATCFEAASSNLLSFRGNSCSFFGWGRGPPRRAYPKPEVMGFSPFCYWRRLAPSACRRRRSDRLLQHPSTSFP